MRKALIVEDDQVLSFLLSVQLELLGYGVAGSVVSGEEAIKAMKELKPDFLLVDINLKGNLDGIETMELIKTVSGVPFIYLTANSDLTTKSRALKTEPHGYLIKPIGLSALRNTLSLALAV
ncbi:MAG: response regulator [Balneolales bacterium]